ncbi:diguanylate cyclase (GGDEF) domain-containing protein [Cognatiyoonia koreensis]|uniref:Diguanylate cyclase (GGDEF) domain-containing protein n=2 Tax=Cognatiyoonia koreensis TaxID=364200 RepID=A0A1I0MYG0_9RHOB|nr:diguanylate cyclase (GGDEF) domain-containing protein [Cognatiyoonia koreensis]
MLASQFRAREALQEFLATRSSLRNSQASLLSGCDAALSKMISEAFSRENEAIYDCFEMIARSICSSLSRGEAPSRADLSELIQLVVCQLSDANNAILAAAQFIADTAQTDTEKLALIDQLTGLPNRRALEDELARRETTGLPEGTAAIMHVDLDLFKKINDTIGHAAGDAALKHATDAMASTLRNDDFLARIGGDEFVLVLYGPSTEEYLALRADQIIENISTAFLFNGKRHRIGASIGIAVKAKADGTSLAKCVINADLALYHAKNAGRGTSRFFTPFLRIQQDQKADLQSQISLGIDTHQFEPFFQPQVEGRTGKLVGLEALARWHHPTRGLLAPFHFLQAAQEAALLEKLDEYLMARTFASMRRWVDDGLNIPQVSINLTGSRLLEENLVDSMLSAIDKSNLSPSMIGIEILESAMIDNESKQIMDSIAGLAEAGFKLELDDFGTGHASISNLKNFKVDRIKIDRSFVKDIHLYPELCKITGAMIGLAHALRVDALAEGVETPEERLVLNALGCDHFQGYGVSRPIPNSEIPRWLRRTQEKKALPPIRK